MFYPKATLMETEKDIFYLVKLEGQSSPAVSQLEITERKSNMIPRLIKKSL